MITKKMYALYGAWQYDGLVMGTNLLGVSSDRNSLQLKLDQIRSSKAGEYIGYTKYKADESYEDGKYCISTKEKTSAKFYLVETDVEISNEMMGDIARQQNKLDRIDSIEGYVQMLYGSGSIPAWKYEYLTRNSDAVADIAESLETEESDYTPYGTTLETVVGEAVDGLTLDDEILEFLWEEFGDILIDDDENILDPYLGFEAGTFREEVWHWFDENYSGGVVKLMFPESLKDKED